MLVRADNNAVGRPLKFSAFMKNTHGGCAFRNAEAWGAIRDAARTMKDYTESFDRAVLLYYNGNEIALGEDDCLEMLYKWRPEVVLLFVRPSLRGICTLISGVADQQLYLAGRNSMSSVPSKSTDIAIRGKCA
jgi:hypothetical protein